MEIKEVDKNRGSYGGPSFVEHMKRIENATFPKIGRPQRDTGTFRGHDPLDLVTPGIYIEYFSAICREARAIWYDDDARILEQCFTEVFPDYWHHEWMPEYVPNNQATRRFLDPF
jgi:hypothetical protein